MPVYYTKVYIRRERSAGIASGARLVTFLTIQVIKKSSFFNKLTKKKLFLGDYLTLYRRRP